VGDKVDNELHRLFQTECRHDNEMQSVATQLPEPNIIDQHTHLQKLLDQVTALTRLVEETHSNSRELEAENVKLHTKIDELHFMIIKKQKAARMKVSL
jgi:hypothetical protein